MMDVPGHDGEQLETKQMFISVDVHPNQCALLVRSIVEVFCRGEDGEEISITMKENSRKVMVDTLNKSCNFAAVAQAIIAQCLCVPDEKQSDIAQLLRYLQKRHKNDTKGKNKRPGDGGHRLQMPEADDVRLASLDGFMQEPFDNETGEDGQPATLHDLEGYTELLYEDDAEKRLLGSRYMLQLCRTPENLGDLISDETLLTALARVLREESRKNMQVAINVAYCFFCFSTFTQFHPIIMKLKVGANLLETMEFEAKRYKKWMKTLADKKAAVDAVANTDSFTAEQEAFAKLQADIAGAVHLQDRFLRVSIYMLLNFAEDLHTESKMVRKGLIAVLLGLLERNNIELLILVTSFLRKLSVIRQNTEYLIQNGIIKRLARLFDCNHDVLINTTVRTLYNLSFDESCCQQIVKARLIPKLVPLLASPVNQSAVLCLFYQLSLDDQHKSVFAYTDCAPMLVQLLVAAPGDKVAPELGALCTNLASHIRIAEIMCGVAADGRRLTGEGVRLLLKRALRSQDEMLIKVVRNISVHQQYSIRELFVPFVRDIGSILRACDDPECVCELVGLLSNLTFGFKVKNRRKRRDSDSEDDVDSDREDRDSGPAATGQASALKKGPAAGAATTQQSSANPGASGSHPANDNPTGQSSVPGPPSAVEGDNADDDEKEARKRQQEPVSDECYECLRVLITDCGVVDVLKNVLTSNTSGSAEAALAAAALSVEEAAAERAWAEALEPLLLCVALAHDEECGLAMAHAGFVEILINRLKGYHGDNEVVLQTVYFFYMLLLHEKTRPYCVEGTQIPAILTELLTYNDEEVQKICDAALDAVQDYNPDWGKEIQEWRFVNHNRKWLEHAELAEASGEQDEEDLPPDLEEEDIGLPPGLFTNWEDLEGQGREDPTRAEDHEAWLLAQAGDLDGQYPSATSIDAQEAEAHGDAVLSGSGEQHYTFSQQAELLGNPEWAQVRRKGVVTSPDLASGQLAETAGAAAPQGNTSPT